MTEWNVGETLITINGTFCHIENRTVTAEGVTPIAKNVAVVDEFGNEYEPTYIKRAKGLVKHGRARFITDNRIMLTRPPSARASPDLILEDISVENNTYSPNVGYNAEHAANAATDSASEPANASTITVAEILSRIDSIISDTSYITQFYDAWKSASDNNESVLGVQQTIIARETTNQRIIAFLERMYDDVKPASNAESPSVTAFRQFVDALIPLDLDTDELMDKLLGNHTTSGALEYFFGKNSVFADNRSAAPSPRTRPNNVEFHIHGGDAHGDPNGNAPKPPRGNRYGKGAPGFGNAPGNVFSKHIQNIVGETLRNAGLNAQFDDDEDDDN